MSREMKDSGIPWIGEIPKDWEIIRTKNVFTQRKDIVGINSSSTQLLSLTTKGIKEVEIGSTSGKVPDSYDTYQLVKKDNIVMCLFDLDCSAVFSGLSPFEGMISPAYKVLTVQDGFTPKFYDYWFNYIFDGRKYMFLSKNIRYSLTYDEFAALGIVNPPLLEQRAIAEFLDRKCGEIDELIALQDRMIEELKAYKQSVITEAVTRGLNPDAPLHDSGIEWLGQIPLHWNVIKTLYILEIPITDGPHETPILYDDGIPFISAEAVSSGKIDFNSKRGFISKDFYDYCCQKYVPRRDDIYMIKSGATTGKTAIVETDEVFTIWSPLAVFRANPSKIKPRYLLYMLRSSYFQKEVENNWSMGTQQNIGMRALEKIKSIVPPLPEQQQIAEFLDRKCEEIDSLIALKQTKIEQLKEYKKSLIYEYVTGKKSVI